MARYDKTTSQRLDGPNDHSIPGRFSRSIDFVNPKLVSIIVPTRERYELSKQLILSIENNTKNYDKIELILIADTDDTTMATELLPIIDKLSFDTYLVFRQRPAIFSLPVYYYSLGLEISNNSYFKWILGNDCEIISKDWDQALDNVLSEEDSLKNITENQRYFYIRIADDTHWNHSGEITSNAKSISTESCCFPILSSNYIKDAGEFYPMHLPSHGGDLHLINIMRKYRTHFIDLCQDIKINHFSIWNNKYHKDDNHHNMVHSARNSIDTKVQSYKKNKIQQQKITHNSNIRKIRSEQAMSQSSDIINNLNKAIDKEIHDLTGDIHVTTYEKLDQRQEYCPKVTKIINSHIAQVPSCHSIENEIKLKEDGYLIIPNFLSVNEVDDIKVYLDTKEGYNAHVQIYSDGKLRKFTNEYNFSTLSYGPGILLNHPLIIEKIQTPEIISLAQSYLGCFPTLFSLNAWWSIYQQETYMTQKNHRDHDDFKFLAFFIYLSDIDEKNGPHVFYPRTQNGESEKSVQPVTITGKAGTAIIADTYAVHRGEPLQEGSRLVCWWRYGLSLNKRYYHNQENKYKISDPDITSKVKESFNNHYLLRGFIQ